MFVFQECVKKNKITMVQYNKQLIDIKDKQSVNSALNQDYITTGPFVKKFENNLKSFLKCKFAHVCSSGTAAIHLALLSINVKKNDIILLPSINFIASYNISKMLGAKIFLVDVDSKTGQMTPENIENCVRENSIKNIKAIFTMYHGGYPENVVNFYKLKKKYKFIIIEDACHALGASYLHGKKTYQVGSCAHADISTFSLHPVKSITTGEGGVITTNNQKLSNDILLYRSHGIKKSKKSYWKYNVIKVGLNYRLSDINCALGISQLKKLNKFLVKRKKIYFNYLNLLHNFDERLYIRKISKNINPSFHLMLININFKKLKKNKDHFMRYLNSQGIFAQYHYIPLYKFTIFKEKKLKFKGAEEYFKQTISIPIFVDLKKNIQNKIVNTIKKYLKNT